MGSPPLSTPPPPTPPPPGWYIEGPVRRSHTCTLSSSVTPSDSQIHLVGGRGGGGAIINLSCLIPQMPLPGLRLQWGLQERREREGEGGVERGEGRGAMGKSRRGSSERKRRGEALTALLPCQPLVCTFPSALSSWGRAGRWERCEKAWFSPKLISPLSHPRSSGPFGRPGGISGAMAALHRDVWNQERLWAGAGGVGGTMLVFHNCGK